MISDVKNASLMLSINTSLLKKTKDTSEALMATLLEGVTSQNPSSNAPAQESTRTSNSRNLDIHA